MVEDRFREVGCNWNVKGIENHDVLFMWSVVETNVFFIRGVYKIVMF